jgi:hypothetical protein
MIVEFVVIVEDLMEHRHITQGQNQFIIYYGNVIWENPLKYIRQSWFLILGYYERSITSIKHLLGLQHIVDR